MPFIKDIVSVTQLDDVSWRLNELLVYEGDQQTFTVPVGFVTDFASVPRIFVWLVPAYGAYTKAAILHDHLCRDAPVRRRDADGIFRRCLREAEVPFIRRWLMWAAVRAGAWFSGTTVAEFALWLTIAIPALVLLVVPGVVVGISLVVFWLVEHAACVVLRPFSRKAMVRPRLLPSSAPS